MNTNVILIKMPSYCTLGSTKPKIPSGFAVIELLLIVVIIALSGAGIWLYLNRPALNPASSTETSTSSVKYLRANIAAVFGRAEWKPNGGSWSEVEHDQVLREGDAVKTESGSKLILELTNGSIIRLNQNTEITLSGLKNDDLLISQRVGQTYHRVEVARGGKYSVESGGELIIAYGTAFDVTNDEEQNVSVKVIDDAVFMGSRTINQGEKVEVKAQSDGSTVKEIDRVDEHSLTDEWYQWNKEEDTAQQFSLGILADEAIASPTPTPTETPIPTATPSITSDNEEPAPTATPKPTATPTPEHSDQDDAHNDDSNSTGYFPIDTELKIKGTVEQGQVKLKWTACSSPLLTSYEVSRSETDNDLYYPKTQSIYSSGNNLSQLNYTDATAQAGKKYYYRVCSSESNSEIWCGNVIEIQL